MQGLQCALRAPFISWPCRHWLGASLHLRTSTRYSPLEDTTGRRNLRVLTTSSLPSPPLKTDASRIFVGHTFYKGKSALSVDPGKPTFKTTENGDVVLDKEGNLFMGFAPATGPKQYDWSRKQVIALSPIELGTLISLTSSDGCEFYHDPNMNTSDAGKVRKALKVESMPDKTGFFFNLMVVNKMENIEERFSVPITRGEFAVMRSSFNFIIPYLMGWHAHINPSLVELSNGGKLNTPKVVVNPEMEWAK